MLYLNSTCSDMSFRDTPQPTWETIRNDESSDDEGVSSLVSDSPLSGPTFLDFQSRLPSATQPPPVLRNNNAQKKRQKQKGLEQQNHYMRKVPAQRPISGQLLGATNPNVADTPGSGSTSTGSSIQRGRETIDVDNFFSSASQPTATVSKNLPIRQLARKTTGKASPVSRVSTSNTLPVPGPLKTGKSSLATNPRVSELRWNTERLTLGSSNSKGKGKERATTLILDSDSDGYASMGKGSASTHHSANQSSLSLTNDESEDDIFKTLDELFRPNSSSKPISPQVSSKRRLSLSSRPFSSTQPTVSRPLRSKSNDFSRNKALSSPIKRAPPATQPSNMTGSPLESKSLGYIVITSSDEETGRNKHDPINLCDDDDVVEIVPKPLSSAINVSKHPSIGSKAPRINVSLPPGSSSSSITSPQKLRQSTLTSRSPLQTSKQQSMSRDATIPRPNHSFSKSLSQKQPLVSTHNQPSTSGSSSIDRQRGRDEKSSGSTNMNNIAVNISDAHQTKSSNVNISEDTTSTPQYSTHEKEMAKAKAYAQRLWSEENMLISEGEISESSLPDTRNASEKDDELNFSSSYLADGSANAINGIETADESSGNEVAMSIFDNDFRADDTVLDHNKTNKPMSSEASEANTESFYTDFGIERLKSKSNRDAQHAKILRSPLKKLLLKESNSSVETKSGAGSTQGTMSADAQNHQRQERGDVNKEKEKGETVINSERGSENVTLTERLESLDLSFTASNHGSDQQTTRASVSSEKSPSINQSGSMDPSNPSQAVRRREPGWKRPKRVKLKKPDRIPDFMDVDNFYPFANSNETGTASGSGTSNRKADSIASLTTITTEPSSSARPIIMPITGQISTSSQKTSSSPLASVVTSGPVRMWDISEGAKHSTPSTVKAKRSMESPLSVVLAPSPSDQSTKSVDADQAAQLLKPKNYVKKTANAGMPSKALSSSYISTPLKEVVGSLTSTNKDNQNKTLPSQDISSESKILKRIRTDSLNQDNHDDVKFLERRDSFKRARMEDEPKYNLESPSLRSSVDPLDMIPSTGVEIGDEVRTLSYPMSTSADSITGELDDLEIDVLSFPSEIDFFYSYRNQSAPYYRAEDVPKDYLDDINNLPDWERDPASMKALFETTIMVNTSEDEPESPFVQIINKVDDEATPPFEFYYTNHLYHGKGVPPPTEFKNIKGCGCIGVCDPMSKTCSCLKRQREFIEKGNIKDVIDNHKGFIYNSEGRAMLSEYPIFECNDACGCTDDCINRVVQFGRKCQINIVKTEKKGWGVFAGKRIPAGSFIGVYSGEIIMEEEAETRGMVYNEIGRTYLFDIDFWYIPKPEGVQKYVVDAFHVGNFTRFLNHSCDPNCVLTGVYINDTNLDKAQLCIFAMKDIEAGQELCFSYFGEPDMDEEVLNAGQQSYQKCYCGAKKCRKVLFTFGGE